MNNTGRNIQAPAPSLNLADIYFVIFRHKWKIIILTILGIAAGSAYYFLRQPPFESQAQLLVRYVADKRQTTPADGGSKVSEVDLGESVMADEVSIIRSFDLAETVATNVGPAKILAMYGGGDNAIQAASIVSSHLNVEVSHDSSVIRLTFSHPDQSVVCPVIAAIIDAYYDKHQRVHAAIGISDDLLTETATQLSQQLAQTERELMMAKTNAGIIGDVADAEKTYADENSRLRSDLLQAEAAFAQQKATVGDTLASTHKSKDTNIDDIPPATLAKYKSVCASLAYLQKKHNDYLFVDGYTEANRLVEETASQITETTKSKTDLEAKYPPLADLDYSPAAESAGGASSASAATDLASLPVKIQTLRDQLDQNQADSAKLEEAGIKISELEHKKTLQENNLKYFQTTLQQAQIDEALGPGQVSNIPSIQRPSPPYKEYGKFYKTIFGLCFGGFFAGLAWAILIEMFLDRSIKRPIEIQTKLKIPFFLSIPDLSQGGSRRALPVARQLGYNPAPAHGSNGNGNGLVKASKAEALELAQWEINRRFNSYYDALRDRLVVYFESINLTRKPKLVAITSTHRGSGVSTIAAGLAASLSETGDGRVLLVDMNEEKGAAQQFIRGEASCKLDDALTSEKRDSALVQDNLYVVTEDTVSDKLPRALPRRFASLIPKLKASDYDYIIFDMPPVSPTSVTSRLAGFMDTVMLVIESEKTDQQVVQQANALLAQSKANVTAVLNKTKQYIPSRLHQDFLSDT